ncbi:UDP-N-acetylglucosamine--peptide N-acetylglucosaminyltransferase 110 kDa subunit, partial [Exaiptasia diaphana]|uniref:Tetratricopeptide repeat protein n=1 Tax=Exaiptasia diaphana TaxID=2652724 RepID=A0A913XNU3_EXADI
MSQGEYKESFDGYDALIKEYGEKEKLLRGRGFAAMYLGNQKIARADYLKAVSLNDTCGNCYNNLARVEAIEDNTEKALEYINQAIEINESNGGYYLTRAKIKYQQGAKYGIVSDYNKAVKLEPSAYHHLERANYFAETGNRSQAILDYDEAIRMEPKNAFALSKRGALYLKYDVVDLALEDLKKSISLDSSNAICWANLGEAITMAGDPKTGVEKYNRAIELKPDQMSFYFNRGLTHYSLEEMNLACDDYKKARELAVEQGFNDAVIDIDLAIRELCDPEERSFYYQHGIAMYNKGQFEEAIDTYNAGLEKFPGSVLLTSFRGNAYLAMHQFDLAMADYQTCIGRTSDFQQEIGENPKFGGNPEAVRAQAISGNANVYSCMSEAMLKSGEPKKALEYAELSEKEWIKGGAAS